MKQPNTMSWEEYFDSFLPKFLNLEATDNEWLDNWASLKAFVRGVIIPQSQSNLIDQVIEYVTNTFGLVDPTHGQPMSGTWINQGDLLDYLQKLKEKKQ